MSQDLILQQKYLEDLDTEEKLKAFLENPAVALRKADFQIPEETDTEFNAFIADEVSANAIAANTSPWKKIKCTTCKIAVWSYAVNFISFVVGFGGIGAVLTLAAAPWLAPLASILGVSVEVLLKALNQPDMITLAAKGLKYTDKVATKICKIGKLC